MKLLILLFLVMITVAYRDDHFISWAHEYRFYLYRSDKRLKRIGGNSSYGVVPEYVGCSPIGFNGTNILWRCDYRIDSTYRLINDKIEITEYRVSKSNVRCSHLNAEIFLKGSCNVEYDLDMISYETNRDTNLLIVYIYPLLCILVYLYFMFKIIKCLPSK
jgi:hypothetical protein